MFITGVTGVSVPLLRPTYLSLVAHPSSDPNQRWGRPEDRGNRLIFISGHKETLGRKDHLRVGTSKVAFPEFRCPFSAPQIDSYPNPMISTIAVGWNRKLHFAPRNDAMVEAIPFVGNVSESFIISLGV